MSVQLMARVWTLSKHRGTELLTLLAIADFANEQGIAYPAVSTLASKCRMGQRRMQIILAKLEASGEVRVRKQRGPGGTNVYKINLSSPEVSPGAGVQSGDMEGALQCAKPLHSSAPKPSGTIKNHEANKLEERALLPELPDDLFFDFVKLRKLRKGPITKTAMDGIRREAEKVGMSFVDVIQLMCERSWQGFNAEYVKNSARPTGAWTDADKSSAKPWEGAR